MMRVTAEWNYDGVRQPNSRITLYCVLVNGRPQPRVAWPGVVQHNAAHYPFILRTEGLSYGGTCEEEEEVERCSIGTVYAEPGALFELESYDPDVRANVVSTYEIVSVETL